MTSSAITVDEFAAAAFVVAISAVIVGEAAARTNFAVKLEEPEAVTAAATAPSATSFVGIVSVVVVAFARDRIAAVRFATAFSPLVMTTVDGWNF